MVIIVFYELIFWRMNKHFKHYFQLLNTHLFICFTSSWLNPLFRIGFKRKLEEDDMFKILPEDASDRLGEELQW